MSIYVLGVSLLFDCYSMGYSTIGLNLTSSKTLFDSSVKKADHIHTFSQLAFPWEIDPVACLALNM